MGLAWRRSLQLRVVTLTLGLSLAVILVLGFVLTSQITDRILEVKVRAATEEIERARNTVSGIVGGEETRSLDSSLQLARNTLVDRKADAGGAAWRVHSTRCSWCPATGPAPPPRRARCSRYPNALRDFVKAGQVSYQYATVRTEGFSGPALDHRYPDVVAGHQPRAVPDIPAEQRGKHHLAGARDDGHRRRGAAAHAGRASR